MQGKTKTDTDNPQVFNSKIEGHYHKHGIFEEIVRRLKINGVDINDVVRKDISGVDEFHVGGAGISRELAKGMDLKGAEVLDIGCGLGGPCRMLAEEYGCHATGIDLSHEFIRTANKLSKLVKLDHTTTFIQGDANDLPFDDNHFDLVWTQHVQMNITDKQKFYSEIHRVLKPSGHFIYYDLFLKKDDKVLYPMPWANEQDLSFLINPIQIKENLHDLGFSKFQSKDLTQLGIDFLEKVKNKQINKSEATLSLNVLMGESTMPKLMNLMAHLKSGKLVLESGIFIK